jgi:hypothetical protein
MEYRLTGSAAPLIAEPLANQNLDSHVSQTIDTENDVDLESMLKMSTTARPMLWQQCRWRFK